jgi:F-type H+-transporting ATPase subunit epsilon
VSGFTLQLFATDRCERIDEVASFIAEDATGSFGLLRGHDRFMTVLTFCMARLVLANAGHEYLGLPGGLLYFSHNELRISTRRYVRDTDVARIADALNRDLLHEERALAETRHKLHRLEAEMLRRLARLEDDGRTA